MNNFRYRLANDFQLAVLTLMGGISLVGITPFLVLRALSGEWFTFAIDVLIEAVILGCMLHAWITGKTMARVCFLPIRSVWVPWLPSMPKVPRGNIGITPSW